jgi:hypothetical protein
MSGRVPELRAALAALGLPTLAVFGDLGLSPNHTRDPGTPASRAWAKARIDLAIEACADPARGLLVVVPAAPRGPSEWAVERARARGCRRAIFRHDGSVLLDGAPFARWADRAEAAAAGPRGMFREVVAALPFDTRLLVLGRARDRVGQGHFWRVAQQARGRLLPVWCEAFGVAVHPTPVRAARWPPLHAA